MPAIQTSKAIQMVRQGVTNLLQGRPLALSLEITHSCNCNCAHCDKGGIIAGEVLAPPQRFGQLVYELKPLVAQISGGEPLLRPDVCDIVQAIKTDGRLPFIVFVTNAAFLTLDKYHELKEAGVEEFSISLDFPDERHDQNRHVPGLFHHLEELLPQIAALGNNDITLISVIRAESLHDLPALAQKAAEWNVAINFSAYTPLRTDDYTHFISSEEGLALLKEQIEYLIQFKRETGRIFTAESTLWKYYEFFARNGIPGCRAGIRSLVVNPDGKLVPCAMKKVSFATQKDLVENFSRHNSCGDCYVSLRANTEKSIWTLVKDGISAYGQMRSNS